MAGTTSAAGYRRLKQGAHEIWAQISFLLLAREYGRKKRRVIAGGVRKKTLKTEEKIGRD